MTDSLTDSEYQYQQDLQHAVPFIVGKPRDLTQAEVDAIFGRKPRTEPETYQVTVYISKGDDTVADFSRYGVSKDDAQRVLSSLLHANLLHSFGSNGYGL